MAAGIKTKEEFEVLLRYLSNRTVLLYHPKATKGIRREWSWMWIGSYHSWKK
jgi:hypothetical protein